MGTWDDSPFGNDTAMDIKDAYADFLADGLSDEQAFTQIEEIFAETFENGEDGPLAQAALSQLKLEAVHGHSES